MKIKEKSQKTTISFIVFLLIILLAIFTSIYILKKYVYPLTHFDTVKQASKDNGLDPYLVLAIIKTESGFNQNATSNKQAKGLMQILDSTASDVNNEINIVDNVNDNIYDIDVNINLGCKYFSSLVKRYNGNYYLAICAYNAGMGNVDKWISAGIIDSNLSDYKNLNLPFNETSNYLKRVMKSYKLYKILYQNN